MRRCQGAREPLEKHLVARSIVERLKLLLGAIVDGGRSTHSNLQLSIIANAEREIHDLQVGNGVGRGLDAERTNGSILFGPADRLPPSYPYSLNKIYRPRKVYRY